MGVYQAQRGRSGAHETVVEQTAEGGYCSGFDALGGHRPRRLMTGLRSCRACGDRVGVSLRALPRLYAACEHALGPVTSGFRQRVSGSKNVGMALNERAMEARSEMVGVLASWADMVVGERSASAPRGRTVRDLAGFVAGHLDWLLAHPAVDDFVSEIVMVEEAALRAVEGGGTSRELGRCLEPGCDSAVQSGVLPGGDFAVSCGTGHVLTPQQWLLLGRRAAS